MGLAAQGKKRVRQRLILGTGRAKATVGKHPHGIDRQQQMDAFIPTQPIAPANIGQPRQPPAPTALRIPGRHPGAIEGFIGAAQGGQEPDEMQKKRDQGLLRLADLPIALLPRGPLGKGPPERALRVAGKATLTAKALPLPKEGHGHHLTPAEGGLRPRR